MMQGDLQTSNGGSGKKENDRHMQKTIFFGERIKNDKKKTGEHQQKDENRHSNTSYK